MPTWKKLLIFLAVPAVVNLLLIGMYYSGNTALQRIVSPDLPDREYDREFGLLENLQNLLLLTIIAVGTAAAVRKRERWQRVLFAVIVAGATVVLLEEIDYGLHYYEYLRGVPTEEIADVRGVHNVENVNDLKKAIDVGVALLFVVLPLALRRSNHPLVVYFRPTLWYTATLVLMVALSKLVAHPLENRGFGGSGTLFGTTTDPGRPRLPAPDGHAS
jgi:hypothetical protein